MTTVDFLTITASICPDRPAIIFDDRKETFSELNLRSTKLANAMRDKLGIKKGDRVAIIQVNCPEYIELYFACAKLGAIFVPLNFRAKEAELEHMINHSEARALFFGERYTELVNSMRERLKVEHYVCIWGKPEWAIEYEELLAQGSEEENFEPSSENDVTVLMYTAGTTGLPKGVPQTHEGYASYMLSSVSPPSPEIHEMNLLSMPMYHVAGLQAMLAAIYGGRTIALMKQFDPKEWMEFVQRVKPDRAMLVPTMLKKIIDDPDFHKYDLSSLKVITYGGAAMPFEVIKKAIELFPNTMFINAYGQTETTSTIAALGPEDHRITPDMPEEEREKKLRRLRSSIGRPLPDVEVKVIDEEGRELPPGEVGEIVARGPRIMKGYWGDEEKTKKALTPDGWLRTGDRGYMDEEGYIYLVGRADDLIKRGGEFVSPDEVESLLYSHPKVAEAAVIGVPDEEWGQEVKAIVVLKPGETATPEEIIDWCRGKIAGFKRPRAVVFVDELPKTSTGKVLRRVLREKYGDPIPPDKKIN